MNVKLLFFLFLFFFAFTTVNAQWTTSGSTVYTNGKVGIGKSSPQTSIDLKGNLTLDGKIGLYFNNTSETFDYAGQKMNNYAFGFTTDNLSNPSNGNTFWLSSYNGIKFFTGKTPRMTIVSNGRVGIGTVSPTQNLTVVGRISAYNSGVTPEETYQGQLIVTKPYAGGQFINLVSAARIPWSIGTVYNQSTFAISEGKTSDSQFTTPHFAILRGGNVGIGTTSPSSKLHVIGDVRGENLILTKSLGTMLPDKFTYNNIEMSHYSLKWHTDRTLSANGDSFWLSSYGGMRFFTNGSLSFTISQAGNVGIGTASPGYKLDVIGTIRAREIKVNTDGADFVFEDDYELPSLEEVELHIQEKKHLPGIASAKEMQENGVGLSELNTKLLQKIEELTLYVIEQNKTIKEQGEAIEELRKELKN